MTGWEVIFIKCCLNKSYEQRMGSVGTALKFGMILYTDIEIVFGNLNCFNNSAIG